jgi:hypothetical protein
VSAPKESGMFIEQIMEAMTEEVKKMSEAEKAQFRAQLEADFKWMPKSKLLEIPCSERVQ